MTSNYYIFDFFDVISYIVVTRSFSCLVWLKFAIINETMGASVIDWCNNDSLDSSSPHKQYSSCTHTRT